MGLGKSGFNIEVVLIPRFYEAAQLVRISECFYIITSISNSVEMYLRMFYAYHI